MPQKSFEGLLWPKIAPNCFAPNAHPKCLSALPWTKFAYFGVKNAHLRGEDPITRICIFCGQKMPKTVKKNMKETSQILFFCCHKCPQKSLLLLIPLMQKSIIDRNAKKYDLPCIYFTYMYIHQAWWYQINRKLYGQIDVNVRIQFHTIVDVNLMSTVDITKTFIFEPRSMVSWCQHVLPTGVG